uniref:Immunoglobulin V-set domain-containing protein n=1 Tax=Cyanistes caeruleus TaxID=156563 RepID=A0A8C0ZAV9_CYACU
LHGLLRQLEGISIDFVLLFIVLPCAAADLHFLAGTTGQITVTQDDGQVMVKQGHPFQTTCKYQITVLRELLWYDLRQGQAPQLLSYQAGSGPKHSGRITTHLNTTGKYSVLKVEEVQLSDTALYLCALHENVPVTTNIVTIDITNSIGNNNLHHYSYHSRSFL